MSNTSKIILVTIIATCILLGLGYAAIQNITLNITGTASASVNQDNFDVSFVGTPVVSEATHAIAKIEDAVNASIEVSGLNKAGQEVTATYDIKNNSSDLSADLKVDATSTNTEYFFISSKLGKSSLVAGESTTVLVTVKLTKTPIDEDVSTNIDIDLTAMPVQPGNEGTSVGTKDYDQIPELQNEYGFYYDIPYSTTFDDGTLETIVFMEDGSIAGYLGSSTLGKSPANWAIYGNKTIDVSKYMGVEGSIITVSDDGTKLIINNMTYVLNEEFPDIYANFAEEKNEYGFYFEQAYNIFSDKIYSFVFHEDGSVDLYKEYDHYTSYGAGTAIYSENSINFNGTEFTVLNDGRDLGMLNGTYSLDPNFWEVYNRIPEIV